MIPIEERLNHLNATSNFQLTGSDRNEMFTAIYVYDIIGWTK